MTNLLALDEIDIVFMVGLLSIKFSESEHELADYGRVKELPVKIHRIISNRLTFDL